MLPPITQEDRENMLFMHQKGLKQSNIAAAMGIPQEAVRDYLEGIGVVKRREKKELRPLSLAQIKLRAEVKSEVTWVHPESIGLDENWETRGSCRNNKYHPDLWFPTKNEEFTTQLAIKICFSCPVIMECRATSIARGEKNGVWGGLSEDQRQQMIKQQKREERRAAIKAQDERDKKARNFFPRPGSRPNLLVQSEHETSAL